MGIDSERSSATDYRHTGLQKKKTIKNTIKFTQPVIGILDIGEENVNWKESNSIIVISVYSLQFHTLLFSSVTKFVKHLFVGNFVS